MDNYKIHKIKLADRKASEQVQELLNSVGLKWSTKEPQIIHPFQYPLNLFINWKEEKYFSGYDSRAQEINLAQLYDFVLSERNKREINDPALISGADAKLAWANGIALQINKKDTHLGFIDMSNEYSLGVFDNDDYEFRLKPQTIKLDLEIPAPYKAKIGGRDDTSFVLNVGRHQYCYNNEEDYTKARDALEAVFEAALRGTNS